MVVSWRERREPQRQGSGLRWFSRAESAYILRIICPYFLVIQIHGKRAKKSMCLTRWYCFLIIVPLKTLKRMMSPFLSPVISILKCNKYTANALMNDEIKLGVQQGVTGTGKAG